jgi:ribosomal protein L15
MTKVGSMKKKRDGMKRDKKSVKRKKERGKRGKEGCVGMAGMPYPPNTTLLILCINN